MSLIDVTSINDIPFLINNNPSVGPEGGPDTISAAELRFDDVDQLPTSITYTVTTLPARGQLELTTAPTVAITSFTQDDIANNRVVYVHDGSETATDNFVFTLSDGAGGALPGQIFNFTVTAQNDAPINTVPGPQNLLVGNLLTFSSGTGNALAIADADAGVNPVQVTLTATNGTMSLGGTVGLAFSIGTGTADGTMTFTGTIAAINTALEGMTFVPTPAFTGLANVQLAINDLNNSGAGGAQVDVDNVSINVANNVAPVINDQSLSVDEESVAGTLVGMVAATDANVGDPPNFAIVAGNSSGAFSIDPSTGALRVANAAALDFETTPIFSLTIQVTDSGTP